MTMSATIVTVNCTNWITYITIILLIIASPAFCGTLYAIDNNQTLYSIDLITKEVQQIAHKLPIQIHEIEYDCINQKMYATTAFGSDGQIWEVNITTGASTQIASLASGDVCPGLEFVDSTLYCWHAEPGPESGDGLRILNPITGNENMIISENVKTYVIGGLAYDICTDTMFGVTSNSPISNLTTIDLITGLPTTIGSTGVYSMSGLEFGDNGVLFGSTSGERKTSGNIFTIDIETGQATLFVNVTTNGIGALGFISDSGLCAICTTDPTTKPTQQHVNDESVDSDDVLIYIGIAIGVLVCLIGAFVVGYCYQKQKDKHTFIQFDQIDEEIDTNTKYSQEQNEEIDINR